MKLRSIVLIGAVIILVIALFQLVNFNDVEMEQNEGYEELDVAEGKKYILKNANIITMVNDEILFNKSVLIEGGIITEIGDRDIADEYESIEIINCEGMYVMPGLHDMHVHTHHIQSLRTFLSYGVTTVRNMMGSELHLEWKKNINSGTLMGPEMIVGTLLVDGANPIWPDSSVVIDSTSEVEAFIQDSKESGYDFIKVYSKLSKAVFDEILEQSSEMGIPVAGHIPYTISAEHASQMGLVSSEHLIGHGLDFMKEASIANSISKLAASDMWICPTPYVYKHQINQNSRIDYEDVKVYIKDYYDAGGKIVSGTDEALQIIPAGISLHETLQMMVEAGLTPYEAIRTATVNPAEMLKIEDRKGTIEVGKEADLVLLRSNPLEDVNSTLDIHGVMTKGRWLDQDWINKYKERNY